MNRHFAEGLLSIFINVANEGTKYLVFHSNSNNKFEPKTQNEDETKNEENSTPHESFTTPSPKRVKLDYDAFTSNLT